MTRILKFHLIFIQQVYMLLTYKLFYGRPSHRTTVSVIHACAGVTSVPNNHILSEEPPFDPSHTDLCVQICHNCQELWVTVVMDIVRDSPAS